MDADRDASGKLLHGKSNGVYAPTTEQKVRFFKFFIRFLKRYFFL